MSFAEEREALPRLQPSPSFPPLQMTQPSVTAPTVKQTSINYKSTCKTSSTRQDKITCILKKDFNFGDAAQMQPQKKPQQTRDQLSSSQITRSVCLCVCLYLMLYTSFPSILLASQPLSRSFVWLHTDTLFFISNLASYFYSNAESGKKIMINADIMGKIEGCFSPLTTGTRFYHEFWVWLDHFFLL